jgi:hypothetical protein
MKSLKFSDPKPELILKGRKISTWRINDEKGISAGDRLSLCHNSGKEFARAEVISTKEAALGSLSEEDRSDHEKFESEERMYQKYSEWYGFKVTPRTRVKVIKFKLLSH